MATATGESPDVIKLESYVPAAAVGVNTIVIAGKADVVGTITEVAYIPVAAVVGADTNSRTFSLVNKATGAGATVMATLPMIASAGTAAAYVVKDLPLSGIAANLDTAAGDVLAFTSTYVGTGIADPGGRLIISLSRA